MTETNKGNKAKVDLQNAMYNALNRLKKEHLVHYEHYEQVKETLSREEKDKICKDEQKIVDTFYELKDYYVRYNTAPSVELEAIIKRKFYDLIKKEPVEIVPYDEIEVSEELGTKEEAVQISDKPQLEPSVSVDEDNEELIPKPTLDEETDENVMSVSDWCRAYGYNLKDPKGFTSEQLKPEAKINSQAFFEGMMRSDFDTVSLGDNSLKL